MTSDLLPPPNLGLSLGLGAAAAIAGAAAWAALIVFADFQIGWLAWGIGALIGFAMIKGSGHGQMLAGCAAVLAVLSIGNGKYFAYRHYVNVALDQLASDVEEMLPEFEKHAKDWVALGEAPNDEQVGAFVLDHGYEVEDVAEFRRDWLPDLVWVNANKPSVEQWREYKLAAVERGLTEEFSFVEFLKKSSKPIDLLFIGLGLATAFSLVMRHTQSMQVAARQQLRAEREAEEAAKAPEEGDN